ncbi:MAG: DNA repair protein RadA [Pseudomonadales bacterium]|jgi:DNA repair protein RadA/Sms|nr:DNA repair protein RadA [Pseudomonadales bacterium]MDP4641143.1 DNA repair protein RadA [Pseudomonadales bacterium]MDP4766381.1 DNA repair protein RadA [Pseudomonadales bacterium]MDP4875784.1 DNA repair protein RadA [Pseudomonadales bacterium]MDP4912038.1 DNA repair protein RadA [Pseudomonadales bacterium]
MAKSKTVYVCNDCGSQSAKWQGQCGDCKAWNTLTRLSIEDTARSVRKQGFAGQLASARILGDVSAEDLPRLATGSKEFDRVLGGGLVPGSAVLISGSPGAGKSTLLIQTLCKLAEHHSALYVTGEESLAQIAMRARRLQLPVDKVSVMAQTNVEAIIAAWDELQPQLIVIDSIQVMYLDSVESAPGGVAQVRESASLLIQQAKRTGTILLLVGHVTKEGNLAGPRVLEHMIDCFVMLEGDNDGRYRTLRSSKNRFGAINELGIFAMTEKGMAEVPNPSAIFLSRGEEPAPGSIVMVVWEGTRPLLVEAQALVDGSALGNPRRVAVGFEQNRLAMLLAVLHRHGGLQVGDQDVFVNAVGGIRITETSSDLALLLAVVSSLRDKALPMDLICFGEVGLSGEIRPVPNGQDRLREAAKHGFRHAIIPKANLPKQPIKGMRITGVSKLQDALAAIDA